MKLLSKGDLAGIKKVLVIQLGPFGDGLLSTSYFETLKQMGTGASTKFIFPMEFMSMLKPLVSLGEEAIRKQG